jgi:hypothetical protein
MGHLMSEAARLIADTLPDLATADDPARLLDAFPRQLDRKDEDAAPLVESLWTLLEAAALIPDGTGSYGARRISGATRKTPWHWQLAGKHSRRRQATPVGARVLPGAAARQPS